MAAEYAALEKLFGLSGYDVSSLLTSVAGGAANPLAPPTPDVTAPRALHQTGLGWPASQPLPQPSSLLQEVTQSLAAQLEEQRQRQQMASALQTLRVLQQQEHDLALLQQQLNAVPRSTAPHGPGAAFQRSRTSDLEYGNMSTVAGRNTFQRSSTADLEYQPLAAVGMGYDAAAALAAPDLLPAFSSERTLEQFAALQAVAAQQQHVQVQAQVQRTSPTASAAAVLPQRTARLLHVPQRSFSSEHLQVGQSMLAHAHVGNPGHPAAGGAGRPPLVRGQQQPGFPAHGRGQARAPHDMGRRGRFAATAKAPSWATSDWHPLKTVLASGAPPTTGTGVFLPHLADAPIKSASADGSALAAPQAAPAPRTSSPRDSSPSSTLTADDMVSACSDPFSRGSTLDFSRASTFTDMAADFHASGGGQGSGQNTMPCLSAMAEEPEEEARETGEDAEYCDFTSLAKELADMMNRQTLAE